MKSPFPGMDPFIEARGLWTDFHDNLIVELQRALNERLPAHYEALLGERTYIDLVDPTDGSRDEQLFNPDVRIDRDAGPADMAAAGSDWSGAATSVVMHAALASEEREPFIEIRAVAALCASRGRPVRTTSSCCGKTLLRNAAFFRRT